MASLIYKRGHQGQPGSFEKISNNQETVLVPEYPTELMVAAGKAQLIASAHLSPDETVRDIYRSMINVYQNFKKNNE